MNDMTKAEAIEELQFIEQTLTDDYGAKPHNALYMAINSLKVDEMYDLAMETPERLFTKKEIDDAIERIEIAICEEEENTLIALGMANAITILNQKLGIGDKE